MSGENIAIGIDLGTTNSCVGVFRNNRVEIIADENDSKVVPSMVTFTQNGKLVGAESKDNELVEESRNTVYGVKRLLGREFSDPAVQDDMRHWPFQVVSVNGKPAIKVRRNGKECTVHPEEISAMVLEKMKSIAEKHLGQPVKDAVITVPAYFDNNQRKATRAAGEIAGLNVLRLMSEPTAAAVAYGLDKRGDAERNVLVYDLGGGTFDISILVMEGATFQAKSITGDTHLGGEDFDKRMVEHFAKEIKSKFGCDVFQDKRAVRRLTRACEKAKIQLSNSTQAVFTIDSLINGEDFDSSITRNKFEELNQDLFDKTLDTVKKAIRDSGIEKSRIDDVVLVGGSTRIKKIQDMLKDYFQKQSLNRGINPDEAVAYGAAVQAAQLSGNTSGKLRNLLLYDIVPLSLGVEVIGGRMSTIIKRNQSIPIVKSASYTTTVDNQTKMDFTVYEGERAFVKDNNQLGEMLLSGIPPEPRGYASVDCTFEIDDDCILHVKVRDRDSGNQRNLSIVNNSRRLNDQQLQRLIQEAELKRLEDHMQTLRIESMNELEFYINDINGALKEEKFVRYLRPQQKQEVLKEVNTLSEWLNSPSGKNASREIYEEKKQRLVQIWHPISTEVIRASSRPTSSDRPVLFLGD